VKTIVLDPGHGGRDVGAVAIDGEHEKDFNLALGLALRDVLTTEYVCAVVMTRETDDSLASTIVADLNARTDVFNRARGDFFLSLHHDSGSASARGASVYVWTDKRAPDGGLVWLPAQGNHKAPRSYPIVEKMRPILATTLASLWVPWRGSIMCADFHVLHYTNGPCALLECFFGSNPDDIAAARHPRFIPDLAKGIALALAGGLDLPKRVKEWNPADEIDRAMTRGIINTRHNPNAIPNYGESMTVENRTWDRIDALEERLNRMEGKG
jgi:N-acetylmuramoyl-L-alanine amidase